MRNNNVFKLAKIKQNNEFYSVTSEVTKELILYKHYYDGSTIFLPCNDAIYRGITNFFIKYFDEYGIKRLYYSEYGKENECGKIYCYDGKTEIVHYLKTKGDFRYGDCLKLIEKSDIIVTGPPYSLFKEFINILFSYNKKFIVLGECLGVSYVNVLPFVLEKKMWFGITTVEQFIVPDWYTDKTLFVGGDGTRRCKRQKDVWYTNMKASVEKPLVKLTSNYSTEKYDKCDNLDAIWIGDSRHIPKNYDGLMCVSCQFLRKINLDQFEIVGCEIPYYKGERKFNRLIIKYKNKMNQNKFSNDPNINKVKQLLNKYGISTIKAAELVGISHGHMYYILNGVKKLSPLTLYRLSEAFDVDISYFGITKNDVNEFLRKYPQASEESRKKISQGLIRYNENRNKPNSRNELETVTENAINGLQNCKIDSDNLFSSDLGASISYLKENSDSIFKNGNVFELRIIENFVNAAKEFANYFMNKKQLSELKEKRESRRKEFEAEQEKLNKEIEELEKKYHLSIVKKSTYEQELVMAESAV